MCSSDLPYVPMNLASAKAVAHFANSAGCRLRLPIFIHEYEPFTSVAMKGVTNSRSMNVM